MSDVNASNYPMVLYVDDEEIACKYFARALQSEYQVLTAHNMAEALAVLAEHQQAIGVIVTDFRMPSGDGSELLAHVSLHHAWPLIKILVTAFADRASLLKTVNASDVFKVLEKPLQIEQVRDVLKLAMAHHAEKLAHQQKMAAIGEVLSFLAHELNTPLATITNFSAGLTTRLNGQEIDAAMQTKLLNASTAIHKNSTYCLSLLSSFVSAVRDSNALSGDSLHSQASILVENLLSSHPLSAAQKACIQVSIEQDFVVRALPNCMLLVLSSLLNNALRALQDHESPLIKIVVIGGNHPKICISDNGQGMPDHVKTQLFVRHVTTYQEQGGSGWGLMLCKRLMDACGGRIYVVSKPGSTTFTLDFLAQTTHAVAQNHQFHMSKDF